MSDWNDFCEEMGFGYGEEQLDNFFKWLHDNAEEGGHYYDPDCADDPHQLPCEGCPGFGNAMCCETYGDYHDDYLSDCIDNEDRDDYED